MPMKKSEEAIKVVVRCRPLTTQEIQNSMKPIIHIDEHNGEISILGTHGKNSNESVSRTFTFDQVYGMESNQISVFQDSAQSIVDAVMEGFNGTIFAYGQTGTGKSYTMEGPKDSTPEYEGIVPRAARHIFSSISQQSIIVFIKSSLIGCSIKGGSNEYLVRVSYLEIYNEEIRDLLSKDPQKKLNLKENLNHGVYIPDLKQMIVKDLSELQKVLQVRKFGLQRSRKHTFGLDYRLDRRIEVLVQLK